MFSENDAGQDILDSAPILAAPDASGGDIVRTGADGVVDELLEV